MNIEFTEHYEPTNKWVLTATYKNQGQQVAVERRPGKWAIRKIKAMIKEDFESWEQNQAK